MTADDDIIIVDSPAGGAATKRISLTNFLSAGGSLATGNIFYWDGTNVKNLTIVNDSIVGYNTAGTLAAYNKISFSNDAAQFYDVTDPTKKFWVDPQYMTSGKTFKFQPTAADDYTLKVTLTGNTDITSPTSGTLATTGIIAATISDADTTHCPDGNSVFDALAGKAATNASTTGSAGSLKSTATTGLMTITGPAAGETRAKTVSDANATIVEEGQATGGLIFGDSSPDTAGEIGYDGALKFYDAAGLRTVTTQSDKLSVFSATSSAELRGVLSDESGTGVFLTTTGDGSGLSGVLVTAGTGLVESRGASFDGGGSAIAVNKIALIHFDYAVTTINQWTVMCLEDSGAAGIIITPYMDAYSADTLPTTTMCSSGTIPHVDTGAHKTNQANWDCNITAIPADRNVAFKVTTAPTASTWCTISLKVTR